MYFLISGEKYLKQRLQDLLVNIFFKFLNVNAAVDYLHYCPCTAQRLLFFFLFNVYLAPLTLFYIVAVVP